MNEKKINYNIVNTCLNVQYKFEFELNYSGLHYKMDCSGNEIVINYKKIILKIRLKYQYFLKHKNISQKSFKSSSLSTTFWRQL